MSIKKYTSGSWVTVPYRKYETATDTITTLPKQIIADGQSASAVIKGNMSQSGTPTPSSPIYPTECGDMVASGEHSGQYQIPILSGGITTPVYLGEVQSTRQIKKYVLTGEETYVSNTKNNDKSIFQVYMNLSPEGSRQPQDVICTHLPTDESAAWTSQRQGITMRSSASGIIFGVAFDVIGTTASETAAQANTKLKEWLAQQYANGTPVTVWYVLATPTTGIVNEPIRKIDTYADSVSVTGIPTTGTAESFDIDTTLKPSEVDLTYHGWHEHQPEKYVGGVVNKFNKDDSSLLYSSTNLATTLIWAYGGTGTVIRIPCKSSQAYILSCNVDTTVWRISCVESENTPSDGNPVTTVDVVRSKSTSGAYTFTTTANTKYILFQCGASVLSEAVAVLMLVEGPTAPSTYHPYYEWVED